MGEKKGELLKYHKKHLPPPTPHTSPQQKVFDGHVSDDERSRMTRYPASCWCLQLVPIRCITSQECRWFTCIEPGTPEPELWA